MALVRRKGVEQGQWPVVAFIDEEHEMVDMADLLQPLAEPEQSGPACRLGKQVGDTGGPVLEFLVAHGGDA
ncbi:hypothetical protein FQZ97_966340 [compost metagenome]